jgi:hypothetical protein
LILAALFAVRTALIALHDCCGRPARVTLAIHPDRVAFALHPADLVLYALVALSLVAGALWPLVAPQLFPQPQFPAIASLDQVRFSCQLALGPALPLQAASLFLVLVHDLFKP